MSNKYSSISQTSTLLTIPDPRNDEKTRTHPLHHLFKKMKELQAILLKTNLEHNQLCSQQFELTEELEQKKKILQDLIHAKDNDKYNQSDQQQLFQNNINCNIRDKWESYTNTLNQDRNVQKFYSTLNSPRGLSPEDNKTLSNYKLSKFGTQQSSNRTSYCQIKKQGNMNHAKTPLKTQKAYDLASQCSHARMKSDCFQTIEDIWKESGTKAFTRNEGGCSFL